MVSRNVFLGPKILLKGRVSNMTLALSSKILQKSAQSMRYVATFEIVKGTNILYQWPSQRLVGVHHFVTPRMALAPINVKYLRLLSSFQPSSK